MFQVSSRQISALAFRTKANVPAVVRCFAAVSGSDAVVGVKNKIPTYSDPVATVDIKSLSYEGEYFLSYPPCRANVY